MTTPLAVCALIIRMDGHCLAVSRRNDPTLWGLPGGKVDEGETLTQAIIREVFEETGFEMDPKFLVELYREICPGEVDYDTVTFMYDLPGPALDQLVPEEGLFVEYFDADVLMDPKTSPFALYNRMVHQTLAQQIVREMMKGSI